MRGPEHARVHSPLSATFLQASVFASLGFGEKTLRLPSLDTYTRHAFAVNIQVCGMIGCWFNTFSSHAHFLLEALALITSGDVEEP